MDWQSHIEAQRDQDKETARQQHEAERLRQEKLANESTILRGVDLIVKDFLGAARQQGFPGAVRHIVERSRNPIIGGAKLVNQGVAYASNNFNPIGSGYSAHAPGIQVVSNGDWTYQEAVQHTGNVDYALYLTCTNRGGELAIDNQTRERIEIGPSTPQSVMSALAQIAVTNGIRL